MRRSFTILFTVLSTLSLLPCLAVVSFFLGKHFADVDDRLSVLHWLWWEASGMWWLSAGRLPGTDLDLELALMLIFAVLPALYLFFMVRPRLVRRRRAGEGLCPSCGYDLRATPERCPECGHVPQPTLVEAK